MLEVQTNLVGVKARYLGDDVEVVAVYLSSDSRLTLAVKRMATCGLFEIISNIDPRTISLLE